MIPVTKTYLPPFEEYTAILKRAWDKGWITNNGELVLELEEKLKEYLNVNELLFCTNGTVVIQMALKALNITKEVITTPFSYVATTNVILWENCTPVFVDIDPQTFCIDSNKIEAAITEDTQAILATHVYGIPCDIEKIDAIAKRHNLKVIYDAAHAFGCTYKGKSLLSYGDISTCSFHATKVFHTVEGGCIVSNDVAIAKQLLLYRNFGHIGEEYFSMGINAKNSEFHAAMGLAILPHFPELIKARKHIYEKYVQRLHNSNIQYFTISNQMQIWNYSYFPAVFESEEQLLRVRNALEMKQVYIRRYFYPSLNTLSFITNKKKCFYSEDISKRVAALPMYPGLSFDEIDMIVKTIITNL